MFEGQPKGLWTLALANTGERFGYYTMLAVFTLFLQANFGFDEKLTSTIFSSTSVISFPHTRISRGGEYSLFSAGEPASTSNRSSRLIR